MCDFVTPLLATLGGAGAATGAAAAAGTAGTAGLLKGLATAFAIAGPVVQGIQTSRAASQNAALIEQQKRTELQLNATKAERSSAEFRLSIAKQRSELAARGLQLDSPTAIFLGETAAREMAFNDQSIRATGAARQAELSAEQTAMRARGRQALLRGGLSAAGAALNQGVERWSELLS